MAKKKNSYEKKAQQKQMLSGTASVRPGVKDTALITGRDILLGGIGGSLAGAIVGRSSFIVGMAVTGMGHYMGSGGASAFGIGMMASGGYQSMSSGMDGLEKKGIEGVKERMMAYKDEFKRKLFLDKIIRSKKNADSTSDNINGMGEVQYFTYPNAKELQGTGDLDMSALERIEQQVAASAKSFEAKQGVSGVRNEDQEYGLLDITQRNL
jgi:hypothetical protein